MLKGGKGSGMEGAEGGVAKIGSGPRRGRSWGEVLLYRYVQYGGRCAAYLPGTRVQSVSTTYR